MPLLKLFSITDLVVSCQQICNLLRTKSDHFGDVDTVFKEIDDDLHALNAVLVESQRLKEHKNLAGQETSNLYREVSSIPNIQGIMYIATILAHLQHYLNEYSERYERTNGTRFLEDQDRAKFGAYHKSIYRHMTDIRSTVTTMGLEIEALGTNDSGESESESSRAQIENTSPHIERGAIFEKSCCFDAGHSSRSPNYLGTATHLIRWLKVGVSWVCCQIFSNYSQTRSVSTASISPKSTSWLCRVLDDTGSPLEVERVPCLAWHSFQKWLVTFSSALNCVVPDIVTNPSPGIFLTAALTYGLATMTFYQLHKDHKFQDIFMIAGGIAGIVLGWLCGTDTQGIILRYLPPWVLVSLVLSSWVHRRDWGWALDCGHGPRWECSYCPTRDCKGDRKSEQC